MDKLRASFTAIGDADAFHMDWQINLGRRACGIVLMVCRYGHCPERLLFRASDRCPDRRR
ncbi:Formyltetrahydrofolate deformylase OS=Streptomyces violarus OX=67380 GN=purU PE=3 SV=1 [Streptomyces violarus]